MTLPVPLGSPTTSATRTRQTQAFYDTYWPQNIPDWYKTREHVREIVPAGRFARVLDAGCGTGVCSIALAEYSSEVISLDMSLKSLRSTVDLARSLALSAVRVCNGSLLRIPFPDQSFELVFSWGVIHHTVDPTGALDELVRVLRPGGTLVLAVYLKTPLTLLHEAIRHGCLRLPVQGRRAAVASVAFLVRGREHFGHVINVRADNPRIESQVEDWYFVPEKHFFTIDEMGRLFAQRGLSYEVLCEQTGRFRSSSNFIVRGRRAG
jgi:ubiquinone/menaquinone biosynthesis C-methylase UbiE